jgi:hypothetical protein
MLRRNCVYWRQKLHVLVHFLFLPLYSQELLNFQLFLPHDRCNEAPGLDDSWSSSSSSPNNVIWRTKSNMSVVDSVFKLLENLRILDPLVHNFPESHLEKDAKEEHRDYENAKMCKSQVSEFLVRFEYSKRLPDFKLRNLDRRRVNQLITLEHLNL